MYKNKLNTKNVYLKFIFLGGGVVVVVVCFEIYDVIF